MNNSIIKINPILAAKKKKLFSLFLTLVYSVGILTASDTQVNGIWYDFDNKTKSATVTYQGANCDSYFGEYSGNVVVPEFVTYNNITYRVTSIGETAFCCCRDLTSITIPNSVKSIGDDAFQNCFYLTSVTIPNSVKSIGAGAFSYCRSLTSINIPNSVEIIERYTFPYCSSLTSLIIGNSVTTIGESTFMDCSSLTSITIPNSVTSIKDGAFAGCKSLTSITIPSSVTSVGEYAFNVCTSLKEVIYHQGLDLSKAKIPSTAKLLPYNCFVDVDIPISTSQNTNSIVLIIANEDYQDMPNVPYALNDGNIFKEYCINTLGIPSERVLYLFNGTINKMKRKISLLGDMAKALGKDARIIFYYTGHGVPDVNTKNAYLMPVDGYEEDVTTGYKLDDLYQQLGLLPVKSITVFLDACFSGVNRNDEALAQHKGARLVAKSGMPTGNMVVFAASQGNQTAFVNDKEQHGLFTYYLLKKLQDSKGDVTLDDLANYLTTEVNLSALSFLHKKQEPSIIASPLVQNQWQNWKLK